MRTDQLQRLQIIRTGIKDPYYLTYKFLFADLKQAIENYASGDVLDIGCGNKPYKPLFTKASSYTGCDIIQSDQNLVDIICPATDIPLADNTKDTVFSTQVIEHVADHAGLLSEAYRILKPGGYLIVSGPMFWEHHEEPYDFFRFTRYGFDYVIRRAGLTPVSIIANGGKWAMAGQMLLNTIRSSVTKKSFGWRLVKLLYTIFFIKRIINLFFSWLDKIDKDEQATLNFVVIAQK